MDDSERTPTGEKLKALVHAVQSIGASYQFFVEINSPEYYKIWKKENEEFLKDPHLVASGGVQDIRVLLNAPGLSTLKEDYLQTRKSGSLSKLLQEDIDTALKAHPEWKDSAEDHTIDAAVYCIAMHRPKSSQNHLKNYMFYPQKKLSNTAVHACTVAPKFGFEGGSLDHFPYNMDEVLDLYSKKDQQVTSVDQQVFSGGSEEKKPAAVVFHVTPPLKPISHRGTNNSPPHKQSKKTNTASATSDPGSDPAPMLLDETIGTAKCNLNYNVNEVTALLLQGILHEYGEEATLKFFARLNVQQFQLQFQIQELQMQLQQMQSQSQLPSVQNTQQIQQVLCDSMVEMKKVQALLPQTTTTMFEPAQQMSSKMQNPVSPSASSPFLSLPGTAGIQTSNGNASSSRDVLFTAPSLRKVSSCPSSLSSSEASALPTVPVPGNGYN